MLLEAKGIGHYLQPLCNLTTSLWEYCICYCPLTSISNSETLGLSKLLTLVELTNTICGKELVFKMDDVHSCFYGKAK
jgi:hypothetical protein